jgi:hypothetical protein
MEKFNRAERRHQLERIKAKRKGYQWRENDARQIGILASTPQRCSCLLGCGNERAFYGRTLKELVQMIDLKTEVGHALD